MKLNLNAEIKMYTKKIRRKKIGKTEGRGINEGSYAGEYHPLSSCEQEKNSLKNERKYIVKLTDGRFSSNRTEVQNAVKRNSSLVLTAS